MAEDTKQHKLKTAQAQQGRRHKTAKGTNWQKLKMAKA
jgi:hypothetical protein